MRSILNYSGFVEGWATYVEFQSYHYAGLDDDVATILELNQDATLSLYASTDIGIHYEGWTLEDTKSSGIITESQMMMRLKVFLS